MTARDRDRLLYAEYRPKRLHFSRPQPVPGPYPAELVVRAIRWLLTLDRPDQFLVSLRHQVLEWWASKVRK